VQGMRVVNACNPCPLQSRSYYGILSVQRLQTMFATVKTRNESSVNSIYFYCSMGSARNNNYRRHETQQRKRIVCNTFFLNTIDLKTTTATSRLASSTIGRNGCHILNPSNLHSISCQGSQGRLGSRSWTAALVSSSSTDLDVQCGDAKFLAASSNILGGKHGSVRRRFITIGLDLHSTGDANNGFPS
jgi:hypothetical protein